MSASKKLKLSNYLRWVYLGIRALLWLFILSFSFIIASNISGGSFYTLHQFTWGAYSLAAPVIIFLFISVAVGYLLAYSEAVYEKANRWRRRFKSLLLGVESHVILQDKNKSLGFCTYLWLIAKSLAQGVKNIVSRSALLAKLNRFEAKVERIGNKIWRDCPDKKYVSEREDIAEKNALPEKKDRSKDTSVADKRELKKKFKESRKENHKKRFILRYLDTLTRAIVFDQKSDGFDDSNKINDMTWKKIKKTSVWQSIYSDIVDHAGALAAQDFISEGDHSQDERNSNLKENFDKQRKDNIDAFERSTREMLAEALSELKQLSEFRVGLYKSNTAPEYRNSVWKVSQLMARDANLQIRELCKKSDKIAYDCFLAIYKYLKEEKEKKLKGERKLSSNTLMEHAVARFRIVRIHFMKSMLNKVEELGKKEDEIEESENQGEIITEDNELANRIAEFYMSHRVLLQELESYEREAYNRDKKYFLTLSRLGTCSNINFSLEEYCKQHRAYRRYLRNKALMHEDESLIESKEYGLAAKRCVRFAAMNREQYARLDAKRYQGRASKILYVVGFVIGIFTALANGALGFLGVLSLTTKLLAFPPLAVNICVSFCAFCAILASLCLTFSRVLRVFREFGAAIDTRNVVARSSSSVKILGTVFAIGAGLVSASFVSLSVLVTIGFIVGQTGWTFLTMTPLFGTVSFVLSLVTLIGAASLYRPELISSGNKFLNFIKNWKQSLKDPFEKQAGFFENFFKGFVLLMCWTAFVTAAVTAKVVLPHAVQFIAVLVFGVYQIPSSLLGGILGFGLLCSSISIGIFVTTKQWKLIGSGFGRWLDTKIRGEDSENKFRFLGFNWWGRPGKGTWVNEPLGWEKLSKTVGHTEQEAEREEQIIPSQQKRLNLSQVDAEINAAARERSHTRGSIRRESEEDIRLADQLSYAKMASLKKHKSTTSLSVPPSPKIENRSQSPRPHSQPNSRVSTPTNM